MRLARDQPLYQAGEPVRELLYLVRFGAFKSCLPDGYGHAAVAGFHLREEVLGLEAIGRRQHRCSVVALQDSEVYEVRYRQLPNSHLCMQGLLSIATAQARNVAQMLRASDGDQRLAAFLLHMSTRHAAIGCSSRCFRLPMSRLDIADFLGMTAESVSRGLARLRSAGAIRLEQRLVTLSDIGCLQRMASSEPAVMAFVGGGRQAV
nr:helix-turn-helix domain-containing protein [Duganella margarita]